MNTLFYRNAADERLPRRNVAAIGCVYRLTSQPVIDRLTALAACCIVIDKRSPRPSELIHCGRPFCNTDISGLEFTARSEEEAEDLGPWSDLPCHHLGPVRVAGYGNPDRTDLPLLHAKMLVLGHLDTFSAPGFEDIHSEQHFAPETVWLGSANWTAMAPSHLEFGLLCDDPALVEWAAWCVAKTIMLSESADSGCASPEPNLVHVGFDDDAMRALCEAAGPDFDDDECE
jgi:hypothetical protein